MPKFYPLFFNPILKEKIWGGQKLVNILNKQSNKNNIGESWEISAVENDISVVANGEFKGQDLNQLIKEYKGDLIGNKVYEQFGDKFPILIKFIDAETPLSVQVHPNDKIAKERHNSFGKNEMWYIIDAKKDSELLIGFNQKISRDEFVDKLQKDAVLSLVNSEKVKKGDVFYIPSGRVHSIGSGILLTEIQQTSDITYRIYDYNRVDENGNKRELHNDFAIDSIDFSFYDNCKINYNLSKYSSNELLKTEFFKTNIIKITKKIEKDYSIFDSFVIIICVEGRIELFFNKKTFFLNMGQTVFLPAKITKIELQSENAVCLEVFL